MLDNCFINLGKLVSKYEENDLDLMQVPKQLVDEYGYACLANALMFKEPKIPEYNLKIAEYIKNHNFETLDSLISYIKNLPNDIDKLFGIFSYTALNIEYDVKLCHSDEIRSATLEEVFKTKKAICKGYAIFYEGMAKRVGIDSNRIIIKEYSNLSKGRSFDPLNEPKEIISNHASIFVTIDEVPFISEPTWASGHLTQNEEFEFFFRPNLFLIPLFKTLCDHFPCNESQELLPFKFPFSHFFEAIKIDPFGRFIKTESNPFVNISCNSSYIEQTYSCVGPIDDITFELFIQKENGFSQIATDGLTSYETIQTKLPRHPERCRFKCYLLFPQIGLYKCDMYIDTKPTLTFYVKNHKEKEKSDSIPIQFNAFHENKFIPINPKYILTTVENGVIIRFAVSKKHSNILWKIIKLDDENGFDEKGEKIDSNYGKYIKLEIPFDKERYEIQLGIIFPSNGRYCVLIYFESVVGKRSFVFYTKYFFDVVDVEPGKLYKSNPVYYMCKGRKFAPIKIFDDNDNEVIVKPSQSCYLVSEREQSIQFKTSSINDELYFEFRREGKTIIWPKVCGNDGEFRIIKFTIPEEYGEYHLKGWVNDGCCIDLLYMYTNRELKEPSENEENLLDELKSKVYLDETKENKKKEEEEKIRKENELYLKPQESRPNAEDESKSNDEIKSDDEIKANVEVKASEDNKSSEKVALNENENKSAFEKAKTENNNNLNDNNVIKSNAEKSQSKDNTTEISQNEIKLNAENQKLKNFTDKLLKELERLKRENDKLSKENENLKTENKNLKIENEKYKAEKEEKPIIKKDEKANIDNSKANQLIKNTDLINNENINKPDNKTNISSTARQNKENERKAKVPSPPSSVSNVKSKIANKSTKTSLPSNTKTSKSNTVKSQVSNAKASVPSNEKEILEDTNMQSTDNKEEVPLINTKTSQPTSSNATKTKSKANQLTNTKTIASSNKKLSPSINNKTATQKNNNAASSNKNTVKLDNAKNNQQSNQLKTTQNKAKSSPSINKKVNSQSNTKGSQLNSMKNTKGNQTKNSKVVNASKAKSSPAFDSTQSNTNTLQKKDEAEVTKSNKSKVTPTSSPRSNKSKVTPPSSPRSNKSNSPKTTPPTNSKTNQNIDDGANIKDQSPSPKKNENASNDIVASPTNNLNVTISNGSKPKIENTNEIKSNKAKQSAVKSKAKQSNNIKSNAKTEATTKAENTNIMQPTKSSPSSPRNLTLTLTSPQKSPIESANSISPSNNSLSSDQKVTSSNNLIEEGSKETKPKTKSRLSTKTKLNNKKKVGIKMTSINHMNDKMAIKSDEPKESPIVSPREETPVPPIDIDLPPPNKSMPSSLDKSKTVSLNNKKLSVKVSNDKTAASNKEKKSDAKPKVDNKKLVITTNSKPKIESQRTKVVNKPNLKVTTKKK
ncbi:hypothetical protein M9Y10_030311 [Tritrichomonas musculus]|uniref:Transglutaminase-like domain-containing protein n=1 Tax=Tritrichomonas musculus TaxID=1915356 RepID=A0ABR2KQ47_9EUKA